MGYELASLAWTCHVIAKRLHLAHHGLVGLVALLHSRHDDALHTISTQRLALGELAVEEVKFVKSYLGSLLSHPLYAVHHLGRGNGKRDASVPLALARQLLKDVVHAMLARSHAHLGIEESALAVGKNHAVATLQAKHTHGMLGFLLGQFACTCSIGNVKISYFFHSLLQFFHSFTMAMPSTWHSKTVQSYYLFQKYNNIE